MKKLIPLLVLLGGVSYGFGQGSVTFRNGVVFGTTDSTGGGHLVFELGSPVNVTTGVGLLGTQYVAELYAGADASSLAPITASISRFRSTTSTAKGKWGNTTLSGAVNDPITIPFASGATVFLQVKAWDYGTGADYDGATGSKGQSVPFTYLVPTAGDPPAKYYMEGLQGFALVPEPSAIALGVLGVAGLLLIRRRK